VLEIATAKDQDPATLALLEAPEALEALQFRGNQIALDEGDAEKHVDMFLACALVERQRFSGGVSLRER